MSVKAKEIFDHARQIYNSGDCDEVLSRLLINRAYYSAYNHVLNEVENRLFYEIDKSNPSVHQRLIFAFSNLNVKDTNKKKTAAQIATKLRQAKFLRSKADYQLDTHVHKNDVEHIFGLTESIYSLIEAID
jgi:hypothetical protein